MIIGKCEECSNSLSNCICGIDNEDYILKLHIANKFRVLRKVNKFTQKDISDYLGVTRASIVNMEKARQSISLNSLYKIASLFNTPVGEFFPDIKKIVVTESITKEEVIKVKNVKKKIFTQVNS